MSLEADLVTTLGPVFEGRFYAMVAPANVAPPYAVYQLVTGMREWMMDGSTPNLVNAKYQISIFGRDMIVLVELVEDATNAMLAATLFKVGGVLELDSLEDPAVLYGKLVEYSIWQTN